MKVVVLKYNAGNVQSVLHALKRIGLDAEWSNEPEELYAADKVIIPGVGQAASAMRFLKARKLEQVLTNLKVPVLGICLGMQLLCAYSEEGQIECLGVFTDRVERLRIGYKVPQVGWNQIQDFKGPLFSGLDSKAYCYYLHSYYVPPGDSTVAVSAYGLPLSAAIVRDNYYGVQFHPEKSAQVGERILRNFVNL